MKAQVAATIDRVVSMFGAIGNWLKRDGLRMAAQEAVVQAALPLVGALRNGRRVAGVASNVGRFLTENRHLRNAAEARHDWAGAGLNADAVVARIAQSSGWETASTSLVGRSMRIGQSNIGYSIFRNPDSPGEWIVNAWIKK